MKILWHFQRQMGHFTHCLPYNLDLDVLLYGNEQLFSVIDETENVTTKKIVQLVDQQVRKFMGQAEQTEDITMLALRYGKGGQNISCRLQPMQRNFPL